MFRGDNTVCILLLNLDADEYLGLPSVDNDPIVDAFPYQTRMHTNIFHSAISSLHLPYPWRRFAHLTCIPPPQ